MLYALIVGYVLGTLLAYVASKRLLALIGNRWFTRPDQKRWVNIVGGFFAAISLAPAIFMSMMFGGIIGGAADDTLAQSLGLGARGPMIILTVRVAVITLGTVTLNAAIGSVMGVLVARNLYSNQPMPKPPQDG